MFLCPPKGAMYADLDVMVVLSGEQMFENNSAGSNGGENDNEAYRCALSACGEVVSCLGGWDAVVVWGATPPHRCS